MARMVKPVDPVRFAAGKCGRLVYEGVYPDYAGMLDLWSRIDSLRYVNMHCALRWNLV